MKLRAIIRTGVDRLRTRGRCRAIALGTRYNRTLGAYHFEQHCTLEPNHLSGGHESRDGGVWERKRQERTRGPKWDFDRRTAADAASGSEEDA